MKTEANDCTFPFDGDSGLTKREYFAAMAMQGILSTDNYDTKSATIRACSQADALIKHLNKQSEE